MEGHLLCIKFLLSCKSNPRDIFGARNDHGEIPKDLAEQFYKEDVVKYIETIEKEKDCPENMESKRIHLHQHHLILMKVKLNIIDFIYIKKMLFNRKITYVCKYILFPLINKFLIYYAFSNEKRFLSTEMKIMLVMI